MDGIILARAKADWEYAQKELPKKERRQFNKNEDERTAPSGESGVHILRQICYLRTVDEGFGECRR